MSFSVFLKPLPKINFMKPSRNTDLKRKTLDTWIRRAQVMIEEVWLLSRLAAKKWGQRSKRV